jgi:tryptophan halogenase
LKNKVKTVTILGGGVVGWFTAALLKKRHPNLNIQLAESPQVPILGVGESTIPQLGDMLQWLEVDEEKWMRGTHSIYKHGNMFSAWNTEDPKPHVTDHWKCPPWEQQFYSFTYTWRDKAFKNSFYSGFKTEDFFYDNDGRFGVDHKSFDYWLELLRQKKYNWWETSEYCFEQYHFAIKNKSPYDNNKDCLVGDWKPYSWHVDAERFPLIVRDQIALPLGVTHIEGHMTDVVKDEDGYVKYLQLEDGRKLKGDLFIDCSGFNRLLLKRMNPEWVKMNHLPTQSVWVCPIEYKDPHTEMKPYTQSHAQKNGWNFIISLYSRMGSGYIFDANSEDPSDARERFIKYWDGYNMLRDPKLIQWEQGYYKDSWVKNVVGVGMAQGFVDPMEANSIYIAQSGIQMIDQAITKYEDRIIPERAKQALSRRVQKLEKQTGDFVSYHYTLSKRRDSPMWKKWGEYGDENNHVEKNWFEYRNPSGYLGRNLYLDYQWAQQHHYLDRWDDDICKLNVDPELLPLAEIDFNYLKTKANALSDYAPNIYDYCKKHIYDGATSKEILEEAQAGRK